MVRQGKLWKAGRAGRRSGGRNGDAGEELKLVAQLLGGFRFFLCTVRCEDDLEESLVSVCCICVIRCVPIACCLSFVLVCSVMS